MGIDTELENSKQNRHIVQIQTYHPDEDNFDGIVLAISSDMTMIREFISFEPDGILIIPKKWIKDVRNSDFEKCMTDIIRFISPTENFDRNDGIPAFHNLAEILEHLRINNVWPGIEIISGTESVFYIGPILKILETSCIIHCYDAAGKWEAEYEVFYEEIFRIEINGKYIRHFNNYMKNR